MSTPCPNGRKTFGAASRISASRPSRVTSEARPDSRKPTNSEVAPLDSEGSAIRQSSRGTGATFEWIYLNLGRYNSGPHQATRNRPIGPATPTDLADGRKYFLAGFGTLSSLSARS